MNYEKDIVVLRAFIKAKDYYILINLFKITIATIALLFPFLTSLNSFVITVSEIGFISLYFLIGFLYERFSNPLAFLNERELHFLSENLSDSFLKKYFKVVDIKKLLITKFDLTMIANEHDRNK